MIKRNGKRSKTYKVLVCFILVLMLCGLVLPGHSLAESTVIESPGPGVYDVAETNLVLEVKGSSTNNHTQALMAWYDQHGNFYMAVQSTHELKEIMEISLSASETYTSSEVHYYGSGVNDDGSLKVPITVGGIIYNKVDPSVNTTGDERWTVYKFKGEDAKITAGSYTFSIIGIGGGHDIKNQSLTISVPKIDIDVEKVWKNAPEGELPDVSLQLYIGEGENAVKVNDPIILKHPNTKHTWKDMDETDGKGVRLKYSVKEEPIPNFTTAVTGSVIEGFTVTNTYDPEINVTIKKEVTGNFGDRSREFSFTVKINEEDSSSFTLKHGESHPLNGLKPGDNITLSEESGNYTVDVEATNNAIVQKIADGEYIITLSDKDTTITVTNHYEITIDTGIFLDSLPYIIILAVVISAITVMLIRKRRLSRED